MHPDTRIDDLVVTDRSHNYEDTFRIDDLNDGDQEELDEFSENFEELQIQKKKKSNKLRRCYNKQTKLNEFIREDQYQQRR